MSLDSHPQTTFPNLRPEPDPAVAFTIVVSSGVTSSGLTLNSTQYEEVLSGGTATSNTVEAGGLVTVNSGGTTSGDVVMAQGAEVLSSGSFAEGVVVSSGGLLSGPGDVDDTYIYGDAAGLVLSLHGYNGAFAAV